LNQRPLPFDERAEKALLGLILVRPVVLDQVSDLRVDDFFMPEHRVVFEAILELDRREKKVEIIALSDLLETSGEASRLPNGSLFLLELMKSADTGEASYYARLVTEKAVLRKLLTLCLDVSSLCHGDVADVAELLNDTRGRLAKLDLPSGTVGPVQLRDILDETLSEVERRAANPEQHFVLTDIEAFDREISGLCAETLILIAARPSKGKSALLRNFAQRAARKKIPALLFSLEDSKQIVAFRSLSFDAEVNSRAIMSGRLSGPEWVRLQGAAARLANDTIWIDDRNLSNRAIISETYRWRAANPSQQAVVLIDYLGLVKKSGNAENENKELGEITAALKQLAKDLKIPVVLAAQLNRDSEKEKRKPGPRDLRGSGEIEQNADVIIFPWWEGESPRYGRHPATLIVAKNRNGATAEIPVDWLPEYTMFADREDLEQPQQRSFA
jgi:replicative DNA helicase